MWVEVMFGVLAAFVVRAAWCGFIDRVVKPVVQGAAAGARASWRASAPKA